MKYALIAFATTALFFGTVQAQENLDGPRFGVTYLDEKTQTYLEEKEIELTSPQITQFGWQYETRFFSIPNGPQGVVEFVPLIGGLEQSLFIPSLSALTGLRFANGFEFMLGPNATPSSFGAAFAIGHTTTIGGLNLPVNLAYVSTKNGGRISLLIGFNVSPQYRK